MSNDDNDDDEDDNIEQNHYDDSHDHDEDDNADDLHNADKYDNVMMIMMLITITDYLSDSSEDTDSDNYDCIGNYAHDDHTGTTTITVQLL